jgi:hypothetical protein
MSLGSVHAFFLKISTPLTAWAVTFVTLLFFWLINFHGVPGVPPIDSLLRIGIPDMMFTYSPASIYQKLVQFGAQGRSDYRIFIIKVDFLFPTVYGLFFSMVATIGFSRLFAARPSVQKLSLLPLLTSIFDYSENVCFLAMLRSYPRELTNLEKLANIFTLAKWLFAAVSIVLLLIAAIGMLIRSIRTRVFA